MASMEHNLGDAGNGATKDLIVFVDDEEGARCDRCRKTKLTPMMSFDNSDGANGPLEVCEECIADLFRLLKEKRLQDHFDSLKT